MHPGVIAWWASRRGARCGVAAECGREHEAGAGGGEGHGWHGHGRHGHHGHGSWEGRFAGFTGQSDDQFDGGSFGVRRPLRFLAFKLELNEEQVTELARILNELKTERAQAAVDQRRTTSSFADAIASEAFDQTKVNEAAGDRVKSAEKLRDAVVTALAKIHALLDPKQRAKLAYLIRTGALTI